MGDRVTGSGTAAQADPGEARAERRPPGLQFHLVSLVLASLLPALTIGGAAAWHLAESYSRSFEARLQDTARALALYLDGEIEHQVAAVVALAASPTLERDDLAAFGPWARRVGEALGGWVIVNDAAPGHRQLLNTNLPEGALLPPPSPPGEGAWDVIRRAVETGQPAVSDLFVGRASGRAVVAIAAPVLRQGQITRVVVLGIDPARLSGKLQAKGPSGDAFVSVADRQGRIVARSRDHERFLGTVPRSRSVPDTERSRGVFKAQSVYGDTALFSAQPIPAAAGWTLVVAEPYARYRASWFGPVAALVASAAAAVAIGLAVAGVLARRILRPVNALVLRADARAAGRDGGGPTPPASVAEFEVLRVASERAEAALAAREAEFRAIFETAATGVVEVDARTRRYIRVNRRFCEIAGRSKEELVGGLGPDDLCHPADRERVAANLAIAGNGEVEQECRLLRPDGTVIWVRASASISVRDADGKPLRAVSVLQDITERRRAEEARTLLTREVDHRAKNALAVVQAAVRLTPRADAAAYARSIEGRVGNLARAHTLLANAQWSGADLGALARAELDAFVSTRGDAVGDLPRVELDGPPVTLAPGAAQGLAMTLHELATNATKHGALSVAGGHVRLSWTVDREADLLRLRWAESGGPHVGGPPSVRGFGSRVVESTLRRQLGGTLRPAWHADGLVLEADLPLARVLPREPVAGLNEP
ncbi:PAS domain S-box protein [Belnapia moabensis]|uniref:PAS domain S-box protein n=1 Tax=Belnapia moabensis TaxID=365533 RepID=UPI0005BDC131|nr:PAS domain S-box protein [Belnapia moabensis]